MVPPAGAPTKIMAIVERTETASPDFLRFSMPEETRHMFAGMQEDLQQKIRNVRR